MGRGRKGEDRMSKKVTRYEWLHSLTEPELAKALCNILDWDCDGCPATRNCKKGHIGMADWLSEKITPPEEYRALRDKVIELIPDPVQLLKEGTNE